MPNNVKFPLLRRLEEFGDRPAIAGDDAQCTYRGLIERSGHGAATVLNGLDDLAGARVAFLARPGFDYVLTQWSIWRAGGVAVPLCTLHPAPELEHVITDSGATIVAGQREFLPLLAPIADSAGARLLDCEALKARPPTRKTPLPAVSGERDALLIYTSGTTGKPKGVLTTHDIIAAQLESVTTAWACGRQDRSLLVLPLHHLHGILNVLLATLWSGGVCEMHPSFDASRVWSRIAAADGLTTFMAVPTIYAKLIRAFDEANAEQQARMTAGCKQLRLMVSGSAALPVPTLERFRQISGHTLLERYGMTEIGMALGNPLRGERRPGHVGQPFPGVEVRVVDAQDRPQRPGEPGHIQVKGPSVFKAYFGRPTETAEVFTEDGYFRTGDEGLWDNGSVRILGRSSVDILKTGGFKVSALEIEAVLREHPLIEECAVVGLPDPQWGQKVAAAVVVSPGTNLTLAQVREFGKARLATYKVPTLLATLCSLPRNALGKVQKNRLATEFTEHDGS